MYVSKNLSSNDGCRCSHAGASGICRKGQGSWPSPSRSCPLQGRLSLQICARRLAPPSIPSARLVRTRLHPGRTRLVLSVKVAGLEILGRRLRPAPFVLYEWRMPKKPTEPFGHIAFGKDGNVRKHVEQLSSNKAAQEHEIGHRFADGLEQAIGIKFEVRPCLVPIAHLRWGVAWPYRLLPHSSTSSRAPRESQLASASKPSVWCYLKGYLRRGNG